MPAIADSEIVVEHVRKTARKFIVRLSRRHQIPDGIQIVETLRYFGHLNRKQADETFAKLRVEHPMARFVKVDKVAKTVQENA